MYNFVDTTESQAGQLLPSEALSINGVYIEVEIDGYRTLQVEGRELLDSDISDIQIGNSNGTRYRSKRNPSREITVTYELQAKTPKEFRERFNKLNGILDQEEATLIFRDEQDKYFTGTKSAVDSVPPGRLNVVSQFTFYCADPYKYSTIERTAKNSGATITMTNNGTKPTPVNVFATFNSDNGYFGATLGDRFYQVGNPGEVDGVQYEQTEYLFDDHLYKDQDWILNQGIVPPVAPGMLQNGTVTYVHEQGEEGYVKPATYGSGNSWHGPSMTKIVPADVNGAYAVNWLSAFRFDFNTAGGANPTGQIGHNSVTYVDENDNIIVSVIFEDVNPSITRSEMAIYIGNERVFTTRGTKEFYVSGRGDSGPSVSVQKIGNQVTVSAWFPTITVIKTYFVKNPNAQLRKITWYGGAYKTYQNMTNNLLRAIHVRKHNVQRYQDIPNYFGRGDTLELTGSDNKLYINGIPDWDMVDIGSKPLLLPPGTHTLGIAKSEWAEMPDVEVTWKERYL